MENKIESLEKRISTLEVLVLALTDKLETKDRGQTVYHTSEESKREFPTSGPLSEAISPTIAKEPKKIEPLGASKILPIAAVICFFLAALFIVRLAIDSGWLNAERQLGLLVSFGLSLVGAGRVLNFFDLQYRSYLSAAGIIVLYLAAFSSSLYFDVFTYWFSVVSAIGVTLISLELVRFHKHEIFSIVAAVGTYLVPLLLDIKLDPTLLAAYFIVWSYGFAQASIWLQSRTLSLVASYFGLGVFTLLSANTSDSSTLLIVIFVLIAQFIFFSGGVYFYTLKNKDPLSKQMAMAFLPSLMFFYGTTYYFLDRLSPTLAPWVSLVFAGFIYVLFLNAQDELKVLNSKEIVYIFFGVILFHSGYLQILPDVTKPYLLPTILLLGYLSEFRADFPLTSKILRFFLGAIAIIEFIKLSGNLLNQGNLKSVVPAIITVGLGFFYYSKGSKLNSSLKNIFLGCLHLLMVITLYRIAYDYGSLAVSISWGLYASAILFFASPKKDMALAQSSLIVLLAASLKALVYDASQAASNVRILSLLLTGIVLYGAGAMFKKIKSWNM